MTDLWREMMDEFRDEMADGETRTEIEPFDDNIGVVTKGWVNTFPSGDMQFNWSLRVEESIPNNIGGFVTLKYPARPRGVKWDKDANQMVTLTDPADLADDRKAWAGGFNRILAELGLESPAEGIMDNEFTASEWAAGAVGRKVVFAAKLRKGFAEVPVFRKGSGKMVVAITRLDAVTKPGLTRADEARHRIQKASEK